MGVCTAHWSSWQNTDISEPVFLIECFKPEVLSEWLTSQHSHHSNSEWVRTEPGDEEVKKWIDVCWSNKRKKRKIQTSLYWVQAIPPVLNRLLFVGESWVWTQKNLERKQVKRQLLSTTGKRRRKKSTVAALPGEQDTQSKALPSAAPCTPQYLGNVTASCLHDLTPYRNSVSCTQGNTERQPAILQWVETFDHVQERGWRPLKGLGFIKLLLLLSASQS